MLLHCAGGYLWPIFSTGRVIYGGYLWGVFSGEGIYGLYLWGVISTQLNSGLLKIAAESWNK